MFFSHLCPAMLVCTVVNMYITPKLTMNSFLLTLTVSASLEFFALSSSEMFSWSCNGHPGLVYMCHEPLAYLHVSSNTTDYFP
jgi:hypothetical protein